MRFVTITNQSRADCPQLRVKYCASFWDNFKGLMFTPAIAPDGGVLLVESFDGRSNTAIHMFFMRFDIAAIWINSNLEVVDCKLAKRWAPALCRKRLPAMCLRPTLIIWHFTNRETSCC
jgi:uncharacterized membrane protein (UPF0127 family)